MSSRTRFRPYVGGAAASACLAVLLTGCMPDAKHIPADRDSAGAGADADAWTPQP
ncbi:hypothetical protein [Leucobacter sp. NPDC077196]|uniref:hypothetical protein n=1 Tax=Leucobacter sp. NPDC077196 TaxID=3154959 RepID=UPI00343ECF35